MNTEIKKVDSQGRIVLPRNWREKELKDGDEVIIMEEEGILKIIPRKKIDLTQFFDKLEYDDIFYEPTKNVTSEELLEELKRGRNEDEKKLSID